MFPRPKTQASASSFAFLPPQGHATENLHAPLFFLVWQTRKSTAQGGWLIRRRLAVALYEDSSKKRPSPCFPKVTKAKFLSCWAWGTTRPRPMSRRRARSSRKINYYFEIRCGACDSWAPANHGAFAIPIHFRSLLWYSANATCQAISPSNASPPLLLIQAILQILGSDPQDWADVWQVM